VRPGTWLGPVGRLAYARRGLGGAGGDAAAVVGCGGGRGGRGLVEGGDAEAVVEGGGGGEDLHRAQMKCKAGVKQV
jgi:hypothetical protein